MTTIVLERVTKRLAGGTGGKVETVAVDGVNLRIPSGETLVVIGPSGSGKTTLLRLIAGTLQPDEGRILHDNVDIQRIPREERGIGMVFQNKAFYPHWKTRRSVGFFLEIRKRQDELPQLVERIAEITGFELDTLLDRKPAQLSGGEQQRVAIARALARDLKLLLLDEPFADLDLLSRSSARVELQKLLRAVDVTTVYVTHNQDEAQALGERVAVMRAGRIEQLATYEQLYRTPVNLFVARFVGGFSLNVFEGEVREGQWWGRNFGGYSIRGDLPDGAAITLGARPEYVGPAPAGEGVPGRVQNVMTNVSEGYRVVEVQGDGEAWSLRAPLDFEASGGEVIRSVIDSSGVFYFDSDTGLRIG